MKKTLKKINKQKKDKNNKKVGGFALDMLRKLPPTNKLFTLDLNLLQLNQVQRIFINPNDCVISALEYGKIINSNIANSLRITTGNRLSAKQTELLLIFLINKNVDIREFENKNNNLENFINYFKSQGDNKIIIMGFPGHIFNLIHSNNNIYLVDPQLSNKYIPLTYIGKQLQSIKEKNENKNNNSMDVDLSESEIYDIMIYNQIISKPKFYYFTISESNLTIEQQLYIIDIFNKNYHDIVRI